MRTRNGLHILSQPNRADRRALRKLGVFLSSERGAYTIPNEPSAFHAAQAEPHQADADALAAAFNGTHVMQGINSECAVTFSSLLIFAVAAGSIRTSGVRKDVTAGNVTLDAADGTNPRYDFIVVNSAGTKTFRKGTAAANPVKPSLTAGDVWLAEVWVPAAETTSAANRITDKRFIWRDRVQGEYPITEFGAVGDDSTDNTAAIQAAIDTANTAGGGQVIIPENIFQFTGALTMKANVELVGRGPGSILKLFAPNNTNDTNGIITTSGAQRMKFSNFRIIGDMRGTATYNGAAIKLIGVKHTILENLWIEGLVLQTDRWRYGVLIDDTADSNFSFVVIMDHLIIQSIASTAAISTNAGVRIRGRVGTRHIYLTECDVQSRETDATDYTVAGGYGVWMNGCDGLHMAACEIISWNDAALRVDTEDNSSGVVASVHGRFVSCGFESVGAAPAILIQDNSQTMFFVDCTSFGLGSGGWACTLKVLDATSACKYIDFTNHRFTNSASAAQVILIDGTAGDESDLEGVTFGTGCRIAGHGGTNIGIDITQDSQNICVAPGVDISGVSTGIKVSGSHAIKLSIGPGVNMQSVGKPLDLQNTGSRRDWQIAGNLPKTWDLRAHVLEEHFVAGSIGTGTMGNLGWGTSGGGSTAVTAGEVGHPGIVRRTSNSDAMFAANHLGTGATSVAFDADDDFLVFFIIRVDAFTHSRVRVGVISDAGSATPAEGAYWENVDAGDDGITNNWQTVTRAASTETAKTESSVSVTPLDWLYLWIEKVGLNVYFSTGLERTLRQTHISSENPPAGGVQPFFVIERLTVANRYIEVDYFKMIFPALVN